MRLLIAAACLCIIAATGFFGYREYRAYQEAKWARESAACAKVVETYTSMKPSDPVPPIGEIIDAKVTLQRCYGSEFDETFDELIAAKSERAKWGVE
jgi:predicted negative regulator of RcsB-dependent stress response